MIDVEFPITDNVLLVGLLNNASIEERQSIIDSYIKPRIVTVKELLKEL